MSDVLSVFTSLLSNHAGTMQGLLGDQADQKTVASASAAAIPVLMEALNQHSNTPEGAQALASALDQHDGSKLGDLGSLLKGFEGENGAGLLKNLLGDKQGDLAAAVSQQSGLGSDQASKLLAMLTPVMMQFLGKEKQANNLDATGVSDLTTKLSGMLGGSGGGSLMEAVTGMLDQNKDGSVLDDVLGMAKGLFGRK